MELDEGPNGGEAGQEIHLDLNRPVWQHNIKQPKKPWP